MQTRETAYVLWFDELRREDVALVGGKSSSLGEMTSQTKAPVPYGFATTAYGYRYFMEATGTNQKIRDVLANLHNVDDSMELSKVCKKIREIIMAATMPKDLQEAIEAAYDQLAKKIGETDPFVAVRSSATAEDLPDASFAGQQDTYLNVKGKAEVVEKVKECYASCFTDRAVYYREKQGFSHEEVALSAAIQLMAFSKAAGVMFTVDISNGSDENIMIEGAWGLGEYVVQGTVTPDNFLVRKSDLSIVRKQINRKPVELIQKEDGGVEEHKMTDDRANAPSITDDQVKELAKIALAIEKHYGCYMDIEWAVDRRDDQIKILQARPETVWSRKKIQEKGVSKMTTNHHVLVKGLPASPGVAVGKVQVIMNPEDLDHFEAGDILVTSMTSPDLVPAMKKAVAIITDAGGMTCHASIVSRELGIPCIVGTKSRSQSATTILKTGTEVTVDAHNGIVYEGIVKDMLPSKASKQEATTIQAEYFAPTATKIMMNLGNPDLADKYASLPCDGVGLMREEFIWTTYIHEHPLYMIQTGRAQDVIDQLANGIAKVARALNPRPVVLRFSDFKSGEYRNLKGGEEFEPIEPADLLGWRGASRYYDPRYIEGFKLELRAVKKVREEFGLTNLHCMIPFCRTVSEIQKITTIMQAEELVRNDDFKLYLMAEIPSNIILADQFNPYIDGYSIGSNDLTMLLLGCDRNNEGISYLFDERNLAVKRAIRHLIETAHKDGKTVSICGQAPSVYPDFAQFLVQNGIDYISVNPDMVKTTKKNVASFEQRLILDKATGNGKKDVEDTAW